MFTNTVLLPSITVRTLPNCEVWTLQWCHTVQRRNGADVGPLGGITTPPIIRLAHTGSIWSYNLHVLPNGHILFINIAELNCCKVGVGRRVVVACVDVPRLASWQHTGQTLTQAGTHQLVITLTCTLHTHNNLGSQNTGAEHVLQL